jgi:hypothetical protein
MQAIAQKGLIEFYKIFIELGWNTLFSQQAKNPIALFGHYRTDTILGSYPPRTDTQKSQT